MLNKLHAAPSGVDDEKRAEKISLKLEEHTAAFEGLTRHVRVGSPGPEIAKVAEEIGAELVVMPTHSRTGLADLGLGSA